MQRFSRGKLRFLAGSGLTLSAIAGATAGYARYVETRRLQVIRYQLLVDGLPDDLKGFRIVHSTDLHLRGGAPGGNRKPVERAIDAVVRERPDLVVLTGDVVHRGRWAGQEASLARLPAVAPAIAVLGNHDWRKGEGGAREITEHLTSLGFEVLSNESTVISGIDGKRRLVVVGVDDPATDHDDLAGALAGTHIAVGKDAPTILLAHAPDVIEKAPENRFILAVAGHTHGGQIRFSPLKRDSPLEYPMHSADIESQYVRGTHVVKGNPLFVGNGIGTSGVPFRFLEPPQVAVFTLTPGLNLDSAPESVDRYFNLLEREDV
jgi:predicted MPP superfamily phosphohydrolase